MALNEDFGLSSLINFDVFAKTQKKFYFISNIRSFKLLLIHGMFFDSTMFYDYKRRFWLYVSKFLNKIE